MNDNTAANADQIAYWNDAAGQTWAELQDGMDRLLEPLGEVAMAALSPSAGDRLLDIGCGTGQTTVALAARVGPQGAVLGVDISRPMLEVARLRAAGVSQAQFLAADAQTYPFEPGALDGVFSRFGVMFFADPTAAFANIRKGLKSGGRLAFVCWRPAEENPGMRPPTGDIFADLPPAPPPEPGAPGPFGFADPERVRTILSGAGFADIKIEGHDQLLGGNSIEDTVKLSLRIGPLGALLREHPDRRDAVMGELRKAFAARERDGRVWQDSAAWIVTARNP